MTETREWGRARLLTILAASLVAGILLVAGFGYAVYLAVSGLDGDGANGRSRDVATGVTNTDTGMDTQARGPGRRDAIAAAPMLSVPPEAAFPDGGASTGTASAAAGAGAGGSGAGGSADAGDPTRGAAGGDIEIPAGSEIPGPGFVATGFPRTPEGAIGQLAQIDVAVLESMSVQIAREVYAGWALPGGVDVEHWWLSSSVEAFLESSKMGQVKSPEAAVTAEPAAALVKGTDGPDWATVCVLLKVTATYRSEGQAAFAHCERMQWVGGRWMLAPGAPAAPAPATWPNTQLAVDAGWRSWATASTSGGTTSSNPTTSDPATSDPAAGMPGDGAAEPGSDHQAGDY